MKQVDRVYDLEIQNWRRVFSTGWIHGTVPIDHALQLGNGRPGFLKGHCNYLKRYWKTASIPTLIRNVPAMIPLYNQASGSDIGANEINRCSLTQCSIANDVGKHYCYRLK